MNILGIESSCDDTACSVVKDGREILSSLIASQEKFHCDYYGVVPEIASRKHIEFILPVIDKALKDAKLTLNEIDAVAVTTHPGLIGSLMVGVSAAKSLAYARDLPLIEVNHLGAHLYSLNLSGEVKYPLIALIVSGGHTLLVKASSPVDITILGSTTDDACGEAFDKIAKHYDLGFPGGPVIDKMSKEGDDSAYDYPVVMLDKDQNKYNFSYSGLKTAVIYHSERYARDNKKGSVNDIAASFQKAALLPLYKKAVAACHEFGISQVGICGGVSANSFVRKLFSEDKEITPVFPELRLCTDNAAMVAGYAWHLAQKGIDKDPLTVSASSQNFKKAREIN